MLRNNLIIYFITDGFNIDGITSERWVDGLFCIIDKLDIKKNPSEPEIRMGGSTVSMGHEAHQVSHWILGLDFDGSY